MDLFLVNEAKPATLPTKVLAIAAAGIFALYGNTASTQLCQSFFHKMTNRTSRMNRSREN